MTRILESTPSGTAAFRMCGVAAVLALAVALCGFPAVAQEICPATPGELTTALLNEDATARAEAAECFTGEAMLFDFPELKQVVNKMLRDDSPDVRFYGLSTLAISAWGGLTTGSDLRNEKAKILQILNEDPVPRNKAAAAAIIGAMDPIPVNQAEGPLLDLLAHSDTKVVNAALGALLSFDPPPEQQISQALMGMTGHSDQYHRSVALKGLGLLYRDDPSIDAAVIETLVLALSDGSEIVQWQAANSLRRFGSQASFTIPDLQAIVWDPKQPPEVRKMAQEAVESITGELIKPPWLTGETPPPQPGMTGAPE